MSSSKSVDVILVHGGFSDGSVWSKIISILQKNKFSVSATQLPLTGFADDVAAVRRHLATKSNPVLLVGHSYGGAVITEAAQPDANVKGYVYVAATVPAMGEVYGNFMSKNPGQFQSSLAPDASGFVWANEDVIKKGLGQDLSAEDQNLMLAVQKPIAVGVYGGAITNEGWRNRKVWYLVSENDNLFPPSAQHATATRMGAQTSSLSASHMSPLSKPQEVAKVLMDAANVILG